MNERERLVQAYADACVAYEDAGFPNRDDEALDRLHDAYIALNESFGPPESRSEADDEAHMAAVNDAYNRAFGVPRSIE